MRFPWCSSWALSPENEGDTFLRNLKSLLRSESAACARVPTSSRFIYVNNSLFCKIILVLVRDDVQILQGTLRLGMAHGFYAGSLG